MQAENTPKQFFQINKLSRENLMKQNALVLWFTGLSGSGKSTIADLVENEFHRRGVLTYSLDGDNIRNGINKDLGFSEKDRSENIRRIGEIAHLFCEAGIVVLASFISPFQKDRKIASYIVGDENFYEIYVNTPIEVCEERDIKGLYKKARSGEIINFTGVSSPYEKPLKPYLELDTIKKTKEECSMLVVESMIGKIRK